MELKLKQYKTSKLTHYIKTSPFFFVFHSINLKLNSWVLIEQKLIKLKLTCYKLNNKLIKIVLMNSIFKNLNLVLTGPCFFVKISPSTSKYLEVKHLLTNLNKLMTFFCLKINDKFYAFKQLQRISKMVYLISIKKFKYFLQSFLIGLVKNLFKPSNKKCT